MKKFTKIFVAILAATTLFSCSEEAEVNPFGTIYGTITDADTNQPIQGANVVISPTNASTVTGADGSYYFQDLEAQQYKLTVTASGYDYNSRQVTVVAGQSISGDINLSAEEEIVGFTLTPASLQFGSIYSELTFTIKNTGNSSATSWSITGIDAAWLSVSPTSGTTDVGKSSVVKVSIDRDLVTEDLTSYFIVNAGGGSDQIMVTASKAAEGEGDKSDATEAISINKTELDFGQSSNSLSFTVTNSSEEDIPFSLLGSYSWIDGASPASGTFSALSTTTVTIYIDRDNIFGDVEGVLTLSTSVGDYTLDMTAYEPINYGTVTNPNNMLSAEVTDVYMSGTTMYLEYKMTYSGSQTTDYFNVMGPINANSSVSDDEGNIYSYSNVKLSLGGSTYSSASYGVYAYSSVAGAVIKGGVEISNVDTDATKMNVSLYTNLRIDSSNNYGSLVFTNVPIIR
ncbi:MAG: carboxypeptidase regulatory-like domain-containing protein [Rikenellaceae bacterium]